MEANKNTPKKVFRKQAKQNTHTQKRNLRKGGVLLPHINITCIQIGPGLDPARTKKTKKTSLKLIPLICGIQETAFFSCNIFVPLSALIPNEKLLCEAFLLRCDIINLLIVKITL